MENIRSTGMTRPVDRLGRVVIPAEIRRGLDIQEGDRLEISVSGGSIVLGKTAQRCAVCGVAASDMQRIGDCCICRNCANKIVENIGGIRKNVCLAATP